MIDLYPFYCSILAHDKPYLDVHVVDIGETVGIGVARGRIMDLDSVGVGLQAALQVDCGLNGRYANGVGLHPPFGVPQAPLSPEPIVTTLFTTRDTCANPWHGSS